jgi:PAS domain S-box-containing protein
MAAQGASERFESLFANVPLALMVIDELGMVVQSNVMATQLFGPRESDPALNFFMRLISPEDGPRVRIALDQARTSARIEVNEVIFHHGSAGMMTGDLQIARIAYSADKLMHFICAVTDQTSRMAERHELQQNAQALNERNKALFMSEAHLAAIINSSLDAIVCVDAQLRITVFNPAAARLFQCTADKAHNTPLSRFLPALMANVASVGPGEQRSLGEVVGQTATGMALPLEINVSCQRHALGVVTTLFARDLTSRKIMESQLLESHKMQAVGTMAGGIAHDFNNILSAILGNVALAKEDLQGNDAAAVSLNEIERAGKRARNLVRQILTFSRNDEPVRRPLKLTDVVRDAMRLLKVALPPGISLKVEGGQGMPMVMADPIQVEQALVNLCTNAIHATLPAHGTITILVDSLQLDARQAETLNLPPQRYAVLSVQDAGKGMDELTLGRIFEPFFTTKEVGQGTGLGLAVVHGVMRSHQGTVDVQSALGQGSIFSLYFPAISQQTLDGISPEPVRAKARKATSLRGHVLYVDDDTALVFLIQRALSRRGLKVSTFSNPQLAIAALREHPTAYDLLVTDYNMPGISGVEVLREASLIRPDLPLALASGYVTPEIEAEALQAGARALIHKPNDVDELCETVADLLDDIQGPLLQTPQASLQVPLQPTPAAPPSTNTPLPLAELQWGENARLL